MAIIIVVVSQKLSCFNFNCYIIVPLKILCVTREPYLEGPRSLQDCPLFGSNDTVKIELETPIVIVVLNRCCGSNKVETTIGTVLCSLTDRLDKNSPRINTCRWNRCYLANKLIINVGQAYLVLCAYL